MAHGVELASPNFVPAPLFIRTIDDSFFEVVIGADAGRIARFEAAQNGFYRFASGLSDPVVDTRNPKQCHEDQKAKHANGVPGLFPRVRSADGFQDRYRVVEVQHFRRSSFPVDIVSFPQAPLFRK